MNQQGFEDYLNTYYDPINGTANSYINATRIVDTLLANDSNFNLNGRSVVDIDNYELLKQIYEYVCKQQSLYKKGETSIFNNICSGQTSYPKKGFCSAAINSLLGYYTYEKQEKDAWEILDKKTTGKNIAKKLVSLFDIKKDGRDAKSQSKVRLGQSYFRKMVLANYEGKCCVTGLNVPQTLRASHIVEWALDKANRMNPENGLCLSATYDAAFDKHLISFDEDYRMIVGKGIKDYYTNEATKEYFYNFEGKKMIMPKLYMPSQELLEKHRNLLVG